MGELQPRPSVHPDDTEVLRVPEADGVAELRREAEVVLEVRDLLDEDALLLRHHEQLAELGDGEALGLVLELELVEVETLGGGGEAELEGVDALLDDLEDTREFLEERDEAALAGEPEVAAEAAEVAEAHHAVGLSDEDVAELEHQLELLVPLDHVVEGDLLAALHGGLRHHHRRSRAEAHRERRRRARVERERGPEEEGLGYRRGRVEGGRRGGEGEQELGVHFRRGGFLACPLAHPRRTGSGRDKPLYQPLDGLDILGSGRATFWGQCYWAWPKHMGPMREEEDPDLLWQWTMSWA